jgi:thioredoxin-like negative regulator of GroEL
MAQLRRNRELSLLHLLYFRPTNAQCTALDETLFALATRHRGALRLVVKHSDDCGETPTVLFVRGGRTIGQMVGDLPSHEIAQLLCSALSCNVSMP